MANKEFNNMLDDYVGSIRKKNSINFSEKIKKLFKSKPKKKIQIEKGTTEEYIDMNDERLESDVIEEKKEGFFAKFFKLFSAKPKKTFEEEKILFEEPEEAETKYEKPIVKEMKENFISKLFNKIFFFRKNEYPEEPEKELEFKTYGSEIDDDVVKILNIVNELFKKLPQNVKYQFRNSKDFEIYSNVLKKYHIIKKD